MQLHRGLDQLKEGNPDHANKVRLNCSSSILSFSSSTEDSTSCRKGTQHRRIR